MMTLVVAAIIVALAIPNFRSFLLNSRMTGSANDLLASIQLARSEAIKRQSPVALCPSTNPGATPPVCRADPVWSNADSPAGWVVWVDADNDASPDATEFVVAPHEALDTALTLSSNVNIISFLPNGFSQAVIAGNPPFPVMLICDERSNARVGDTYRKRAVTVSQTGRPAVLRTEGEFIPLATEGNCPEA